MDNFIKNMIQVHPKSIKLFMKLIFFKILKNSYLITSTITPSFSDCNMSTFLPLAPTISFFIFRNFNIKISLNIWILMCISSSYEEPQNPDLVLETKNADVNDCAQKVLEKIKGEIE